MNNRYDFVYLFDVTDGNPNGDPDAGNLPRVDPETGHGLVTDVCLKRKVRNYVLLTKEDKPPNRIYVKERAVLSLVRKDAYTATTTTAEPNEEAQGVREWMCANFYDIRAFGAVMSTKEYNCGQVRGPVQFAFGRSVDPIISAEHSITRCAVETAREAEQQKGDNRTMGRKFTVPYGLYRAHGFVSPHLAEKTGFSEADLQLLWKALAEMFDHDHSAARGQMAARRLVVFRHTTPLGNARANELFERVEVQRKDKSRPARAFADYAVAVDESGLPEGVKVLEEL
jgi:CRISPR-associated protein Csd2